MKFVIHWTITIILLQLLALTLTGEAFTLRELFTAPWDVLKFPVISTVSNWLVMNLFFLWFYLKKHELKYIIEPKTDNKTSENVWLTVEMNIMMNYIIKYICFKHKLSYYNEDDAPTLIISIIYLLTSEEILFYHLHYAMHSKKLKWIHKWHHEIIYPEPQHSIYCSPIEHMVVNMIPILVPGSILNVNPWILLIWEIVAALNTMNGHSNKHLKFMPLGDKHLLHHTLSTVNFGVLSFFDVLVGSNKIM
jgi:hypothetical protein